MTLTLPRLSAALILILASAACGGASRAPAAPPVEPSPGTASGPSGGSYGRPITRADVDFMTGMIAHHAQAVLIAGWAPTNGASPSILRLCERVVVGQRDEIAVMQQWLRDHGELVPPGNAAQDMHGIHDGSLMPGMLTAAELNQLEGARGAEFDRLFLTLMIKHHEGALTMVQQLIDAPGAAQDNLVFKLASDIHTDQTTEIARMQGMLAVLTLDPIGS